MKYKKNKINEKQKIPPPLTLEFFGGGRHEISEKYFTWPPEIYPPPRVFLGF